MKKVGKRLVLLMLVFSITCLCVACGSSGDGGNNTVIDDGKTVNVRIYNAGYGTAYIYAIAEQFNKTYEQEGYKINVLAPQEDLSNTIMLQDIYNNSGVDLYFCSCPITLAVDTPFSPYGQMVEDITDTVLNQKPIRFDGTEEDQTVLEKLAGLKFDMTYQNKYYSMPYVYGFGGLAVNTKLLAEYDLELPRTTNEFFACIDKVMDTAATTRIFPVTYSKGGTYPNSLVRAWMAQYSGKEYIERFWSMLDSNGNNLDKPYEVFADPSIELALKHFYRLYDFNAVADGAATQTFRAAQAQIMRGDALFYAVGDWMLNEEFDRFVSQRNDVTIINIPVISDLGVKLFGSAYSEAKCEQILSLICKYADDYKTVSEIKTLVDSELNVSLNLADIEEVCKARGYIDPSTASSMIFLSINSKVKEIASLFMRMCASTEGGTLISQNIRMGNPFARTALSDSEYEWIKSSSKILANPYADPFRATMTMTDYRNKLSVNTMFPFVGNSIVTFVSTEGKTIYTGYNLDKTGDISLYANSAATTAQNIYNHAKKQYDDGIWNVSK